MVPSLPVWQQLITDRLLKQPPLPSDTESAWRKLVGKLCTLPTDDSQYITDRVILWVRDRAFEHAVIKAAELVDRAKAQGIRDYDAARGLINEALIFAAGDGENVVRQFPEQQSRLSQMAYHPVDLNLKIATLLKPLDSALDGGLGRGEMCVWAGPPSRGKTASLVCMAKASLLQGHHGIYVTCESTKDVIAHRVDRAISRMSRVEMRSNLTEAGKRIATFERFGGSLTVIELIGKQATVDNIRHAVERLKASDGTHPDVVFVDYPGEMRSGHAYSERRHELAEIFRDIRAYGKEIQAAIHTATQMNRGSLSRPVVGMSDIAECFEINAITDVMIGLCQTQEESNEHLMRLFIAKSKENEARFIIPVKWRPEIMSMIAAGNGNGELIASQPGETVH